MTADPGVEDQPSLSHNNEFLVYSSRSGSRTDSGIHLLRVGGTRSIELTEDMTTDEFDPRFSPDGKYITFRSGDRLGDGSLYIMEATGEARRRLDIDGHSPDWSPDGKYLVYATGSYTDPSVRPEPSSLRILNIESGEDRHLYTGDSVDPKWSPDGEWVVFWTIGKVNEDGSYAVTGRRDLGIVKASGTDFHLITDDIEFDWSPCWSSDGSKILFCSDRGGPMGIWEMDFDSESGQVTSAPRALPTPTEFAGRLDVSRLNNSMVFVSNFSQYVQNRIKINLDTFSICCFGSCFRIS